MRNPKNTNVVFAENINDITNAVLKKILKQKPSYMSIFSNWSQIVGDEIAAKSAPYKVITQGDKKILVLKSKKGSSLELQHCTTKIMDDINHFLGKFVFSSVKIIQLDANELF